jgi:hypothetical protein
MHFCLEIANDAIVKFGRHAGDMTNQRFLASFEARAALRSSQRVAYLVASISCDMVTNLAGNVDVAV